MVAKGLGTDKITRHDWVSGGKTPAHDSVPNSVAIERFVGLAPTTPTGRVS